MFTGNVAMTNEVPGSFWRPESYMASVPSAHVSGFKPEVNVSISERGMELSRRMSNVNERTIEFIRQKEKATV